MTIKTTSSITAAILCLALAACDGEPSSADMQGAFSRVFAKMSGPEMAVVNLQLGGKAPGHNDDPTEVSNLRKTMCSAAKEGGYDCEFTVAINGVDRRGLKGRFFKGGDGNLEIAER